MWTILRNRITTRTTTTMPCSFLAQSQSHSLPPFRSALFKPSPPPSPNRHRHRHRHLPPPLSSGFSGGGWSPAIRPFCSTSGCERRAMAGRLESCSSDPSSVSYLTQREAAEIDEELMGPLGFSVDQLMELAGLSVATSIAEVYKASEYKRIPAICGPGNNGGDGLVAARHLFHFGYKPYICYPKRTPKPPCTGLVTQLESLRVPFLPVEDLPPDLSTEYNVLLDAVFGFSFHGAARPPFDDILRRLVGIRKSDQTNKKSPVIVSVDIPSGWHVEEGDISGEGIKPDMLVSLTAPKLCAKQFHGPHHFLGGRFVPPPIAEKYNLWLPPYPGASKSMAAAGESIVVAGVLVVGVAGGGWQCFVMVDLW